MRTVNYIVVHCSATREGQDFGVDDIRDWHMAKGWKDVGYHYVIRLNGTIETGRPEKDVGAHVKSHNHDSIGVCYIGGYDEDGAPADTRTEAQLEALERLCRKLVARFPNAELLGHRDFPHVNKACPCFDARKWWAELTT